MITTLVIPESIAEVLREIVQLDVETAAVLLARQVVANNGDIRLLGRELHLVPDEAYEVREIDALQIISQGYVPALGRAAELGCIPIWLHTHPGNNVSPRPSPYDDEVDGQITDLFQIRSGSDFYGSIVISHSNRTLRFTGRIESEKNEIVIDRLYTIGSRMALARNDFEPSQALAPIYDRNIRAFGGDLQGVLHDLKVAIVGCGGTGSAVAEQLVRLGVRRFLLIDPELLSASNVTRVYGSGYQDVGRAKVDVIGDNIEAIDAEAVVERIISTITCQETARMLIGCDVVFCCTDDNAGRLVLSRFASYMLTPLIDCGVLLTSDSNDLLEGIHGRITLVYPGTACLVCRNRIDISRAASEGLTPEERVRRIDEGYAPALQDNEPAVVAFTTLVASSAVQELLERLIHYGPEPTPSEILLRMHDREISTNECQPRERHYCHPITGKLGFGLSEPFLGLTWKT